MANTQKTLRAAMTLALPVLLGITATSSFSIAHADDVSSGDVNVGIGLDYATGKYGTTQTTKAWTVPLKLGYETDDVAFELTTPYVRQTAPAGRIAGRRTTLQQTRPTVTASGLGDVELSATRYLVQDQQSGVTFDIEAVIKFGTGDVHKGLGTGANDYSLQADLSKRFDAFAVTGTVGYSWLGSAGRVVVNGFQENLQFKNVPYGSLDGSYKIGASTKLGLTYFAEKAIEQGGPPQKELTLYTSVKTSDNGRLRFYVLKGLANGSPDYGGGVAFTASF